MTVYNFSAGPCTLPRSALEEAAAELVDFGGTGMSLVEMSHRSDEYEAVHEEALALARDVFDAPDDFSVLFVQGGASLQFAMVPLNLLRQGEQGGYVDTGTWASKAVEDAGHHGDVYVAWDGSGDGYRRVPAAGEIEVRPGSRYLHITSNETIGGIRFPEFPAPGVPLVADMSSDYMSRRIPWDRFDLVYGGVQKNLGPAGMAVVFARDEVVDAARHDLASYLRYDVHRDKGSLYNTPPVFTIWLTGKVLRWMRDRGGIDAMEAAAMEKAAQLYDVIDGGFYRSPVDVSSRSLMNVVFRLPDERLEEEFLAEAEAAGMVNLKGHRSVGGIRASIYNAMPRHGVAALAGLMTDFRARYG